MTVTNAASQPKILLSNGEHKEKFTGKLISKIKHLFLRNAQYLTFAFGFFVISDPSFCPWVCKINDQDQLDKYEKETTNHSKVHPDLLYKYKRRLEFVKLIKTLTIIFR